MKEYNINIEVKEQYNGDRNDVPRAVDDCRLYGDGVISILAAFWITIYSLLFEIV